MSATRPPEPLRDQIATIFQASKATDKSADQVAGEVIQLLQFIKDTIPINLSNVTTN